MAEVTMEQNFAKAVHSVASEGVERHVEGLEAA